MYFKQILDVMAFKFWVKVPYQRTNGPVNAHLYIPINMFEYYGI